MNVVSVKGKKKLSIIVKNVLDLFVKIALFLIMSIQKTTMEHI